MLDGRYIGKDGMDIVLNEEELDEVVVENIDKYYLLGEIWAEIEEETYRFAKLSKGEIEQYITDRVVASGLINKFSSEVLERTKMKVFEEVVRYRETVC